MRVGEGCLKRGEVEKGGRKERGGEREGDCEGKQENYRELYNDNPICNSQF